MTHPKLPTRKPVLQQVDDFTRKHPDIKVSPPVCTRSGKWEVHVPGEGTAFYDRGERCLEALNERWPE